MKNLRISPGSLGVLVALPCCPVAGCLWRHGDPRLKLQAKPPSQRMADLVTLKDGGEVQAGIVAIELAPQSAPQWLNAPGEVKANDYRSVQVTTRVPAQVVRRHARLGDQVKAGQALATLTSTEVAEAQGRSAAQGQPRMEQGAAAR